MASAKRGETCPQCGQLHLKCLGHWIKIPDKPCNHKPKGNKLGPGDFCRYHGGTVIAKQINDRLIREGEATRTLRQMKLEPVGDPILALEQAVAEARATYEYYKQSIADIEADEQRYKSEKGIEQLRSEVMLMERWHDRYTLGLATLQKLRKQNDHTAGDTLLDLIKQAVNER